MNALRTTLSLALLALTAAASHAQSSAPRTAAPARAGITDIMRAGPSVAVPPPAARAAAPVQRAAEYIVALVNSEPITNTQVQRRAQRVLEEGGPQVANMPRNVLLREVLEQLISERAQLQLAKEQGVRVDAAAIEQGEQTVARQNELTLTQLYARLSEAGLSREEFRNNIRDQLLLTRLRERELESRVRVSEREIDEFIAEQRGEAPGASSERLNIAQVLLPVPDNAGESQVAALQKQAQEIAARARGGEDFAKLAGEFSRAPEARSAGGALGLRSADRYPSLFVESTRNLKVGEVTGPLRSGAGFHVLKLLARERASAAADTITQTQVRHILIRPDDKQSAEQIVARLQGYKRSVQGGSADFAALAREHSQDTGSARNGGELGWTSPGSFVPEFEQAMNQLQPGQISEPVVSRFGVHLIQVQGRRDAKVDPRELRQAARNALRDRKMDQAYEAWAQEVRHRAYVEMREPPNS
ncbi:peptidylprolyl isomerase [Xenophilus arseniciresistens]|uniref:Chaperone SurA n=1 Tax=Xenophilus arseniciresistens TaxID=1283306 RepID=A0AAE3NAM7_9BURK|nr:peptidylprolyl isomerase [Xenophilus arseniciresistens]MDA7419220.1 peptidylprolyl isomerase [Xenophilus arseniciresistens]